ncbi:MAG: metallopeptidase family protein [Pyrinomonadaceae bacterium]|nr:metallopeptidase family protein [Phycisphaerales bacterium]
MTDAERDRFDGLLEGVLDGLPPGIRALLDELSVVVLDQPTPAMVEELRGDGLLANEDGTESDGSDLCGLHTGVGLTERSIDDAAMLPDQIHLFRAGIVGLALDEQEMTWESPEADAEVREEIRITLLHEIGHHFGLEEGDLDELGYA